MSYRKIDIYYIIEIERNYIINLNLYNLGTINMPSNDFLKEFFPSFFNENARVGYL